MIKLNNLNYKKNKEIDIDEYVSIRESVKEGMAEPSWLGDFKVSDITSMMDEDKLDLWLFYDGDAPVCSMMGIKEDDMVDYGPMFVLKDYRGNNLQFQCLEYLDYYYSNEGYKKAFTTIHPDNIYSIQNVLKDNFKFLETKQHKRGIRNSYIKELG